MTVDQAFSSSRRTRNCCYNILFLHVQLMNSLRESCHRQNSVSALEKSEGTDVGILLHKTITNNNWSSFLLLFCSVVVLDCCGVFLFVFGLVFFSWEDNASDERETYFLNKKFSQF